MLIDSSIRLTAHGFNFKLDNGHLGGARERGINLMPRTLCWTGPSVSVIVANPVITSYSMTSTEQCTPNPASSRLATQVGGGLSLTCWVH